MSGSFVHLILAITIVHLRTTFWRLCWRYCWAWRWINLWSGSDASKSDCTCNYVFVYFDSVVLYPINAVQFWCLFLEYFIFLLSGRHLRLNVITLIVAGYREMYTRCNQTVIFCKPVHCSRVYRLFVICTNMRLPWFAEPKWELECLCVLFVVMIWACRSKVCLLWRAVTFTKSNVDLK